MNVAHMLFPPQARGHDTYREGVALGLVMASATWLWIAIIDAISGQPFFTAGALGGVVLFTVVHYTLNVTYGVVLLSAVHGAERTPSLIIAALVGVITLESAFAMLANLLSHTTLGGGAWITIFGGSVIATVLAAVQLSRTHPIATYVHRAEDE
jgi:hypothetical protein